VAQTVSFVILIGDSPHFDLPTRGSRHNDVALPFWECASADGCVRPRRIIRSRAERAIFRDFGKLQEAAVNEINP
jgi:hypothetical protein